MVLQVKPFDFTIPERYSDRDGQANANAPVEPECPRIPEVELASFEYVTEFEGAKIFQKA